MNQGARDENERMWRRSVLDRLDEIILLLRPTKIVMNAGSSVTRLEPEKPDSEAQA